ncbi:MAG: tyrosine-protein phosphatase [Robiginitomaculum sp.]|nr:tyrosine-protein phosphatase [Robiginitomaculum sp.]
MKRSKLLVSALAVSATALISLSACEKPKTNSSDKAQKTTSKPVENFERLLPLKGGLNFRDLGGYAARDGKTLKPGLLFRSGSMGGLTTTDKVYLKNVNVKTVYDLRSDGEREKDPNVWATEDEDIKYWARQYSISNVDLGKILRGNPKNFPSPEEMQGFMIEFYTTLPTEQKTSFKAIFSELTSGSLPLAFNCTAGKDRTGLASALILSALDVPYETIMTDYLLSNTYLSDDVIKRDKTLNAISTRLPKDLAKPLLKVIPVYLDAAFDSIKQQYGSVENYLASELGVGPDELTTLRRRLLH